MTPNHCKNRLDLIVIGHFVIWEWDSVVHSTKLYSTQLYKKYIDLRSERIGIALETLMHTHGYIRRKMELSMLEDTVVLPDLYGPRDTEIRLAYCSQYATK